MSWRLLSATVGLLCGTLLGIPFAVAQESKRGQESVQHELLPPPRSLRRGLSQAQLAIQQGEFGDAASLLASVAQELRTNDYFVVPENTRLVTGFRTEFHRLMSTLPAPAWQSLEVLAGADAQAELDRAIKSRDVARLRLLARDSFFTRAGSEASVLLVRLDIDQGRPADALRQLDRLSSFPTHVDQAELAELRDRCLSMPDAEQAAVAKENWLAYRGHASHNARRPAVPITETPAWRLATRGENPQPASADKRSTPSMSQVGRYFIPTLSPLIVADQVLARTDTALIGIDASNGRQLWRYPPPSIELKQVKPPKPQKNVRFGISLLPVNKSYQRVFQDATYGRISSDGERVFLVDSLDVARSRYEIERARRMAGIGRGAEIKTATHNRLVALDVGHQGAMQWVVGGPDGAAEPKLAGVFFLGPPLALDDQLFVIGEVKGLVQLFVLDPYSGRLAWSMKLAQLESSIADMPTRRFNSATPVHHDTVLICPTTSGALAAIDLTTRSFLWGYKFGTSIPAPLSVVGNPSNPMTMIDRWTDPSLYVCGDDLVVTRSNADMVCLDVATGRLKWTRPREATLFVATAGEDLLMCVCRHRFYALQLRDGRLAWEVSPFVAIPAGGVPSGRGYSDGNFYYLPTSDPELIKIDLATGKVVKRHHLAGPLGNLACVQGRLISQTAEELVSYATVVEAPPVVSEAIAAALQASSSKLIEAFYSHSFAARERACESLLKAGKSVVPELAVAARGGHHEVAFRATGVLLRLMQNADPEISDAAFAALREPLPGDSYFATGAIARYAAERRTVAIAKLKSQGIRINGDATNVSVGISWRGRPETLSELRWLIDAESIELRYSRISDKVLPYLRYLPKLKTLNLHRSSITGAGLGQLAELPALQTLLLQETKLGDDDVEYLRQFTQVRAMNLLRTKLSAEAVAKLREALPDTQIVH